MQVIAENVEVLLVALAVAMAIRTFFLQPFKIPTGSMQPTLFGVNSENLLGDKSFVRPTGWERVKEWFERNFLCSCRGAGGRSGGFGRSNEKVSDLQSHADDHHRGRDADDVVSARTMVKGPPGRGSRSHTEGGFGPGIMSIVKATTWSYLEGQRPEIICLWTG